MAIPVPRSECVRRFQQDGHTRSLLTLLHIQLPSVADGALRYAAARPLRVSVEPYRIRRAFAMQSSALVCVSQWAYYPRAVGCYGQPVLSPVTGFLVNFPQLSFLRCASFECPT